MPASYGPAAPEDVAHPVMRMEWRDLTFLHWAYEPAVVHELLPSGLEPETYDGAAWVGLVPFRMVVRAPAGPALPWLSFFPETNVRTYVRGLDGRTGVWFFSLDAGRLPAVVTARATYRLPYFWSRMAVERGPDQVRYTSRRRWPGPAGAHSTVIVRPGAPWRPAELTAFDHYLTARFRLYAALPGMIAYSRAAHPPWPLQRAEVLRLDESLVTAAGLPRPVGAPVVHYSDGVEVRVSVPRPAGGRG